MTLPFRVASSRLFLSKVLDTIGYLLRDKFSNAAAAGFTSPLLSVPGDGKLVRHLDSTSIVSIADDSLKVIGNTVVDYLDPAYYWTNNADAGFFKQADYPIIFKLVPFTTTQIGVSTNAALTTSTQIGVRFSGSNQMSFWRIAAVPVGTWTNATYLVALIPRADDTLGVWIKGGIYTEWTLLFVDIGVTNTPIFPFISAAGSSMNINLHDIYLPKLQVPDVRILRQTSPVINTKYNSDVDGIFHITHASIGGASGRFIELKFRYQDSSNYLFARYAWSGTVWEMHSGHVIAGVETITNTTSNGAADQAKGISVVAVGSLYNVYLLRTSSNSWQRIIADVTDTNFQAISGMAYNMTPNNPSLTILMSFPRQNLSLSAALDRTID